jgi:hypothetical protein
MLGFASRLVMTSETASGAPVGCTPPRPAPARSCAERGPLARLELPFGAPARPKSRVTGGRRDGAGDVLAHAVPGCCIAQASGPGAGERADRGGRLVLLSREIPDGD